MKPYVVSAMVAALSVSTALSKPPQAPPVESAPSSFSWVVTDKKTCDDCPCGIANCPCGCCEGGTCTCATARKIGRAEGTVRADGCTWTNEEGGYWFRWTTPAPTYSARPVQPMEFQPQQMQYAPMTYSPAPMRQTFQGFGGFQGGGGVRGCSGGG